MNKPFKLLKISIFLCILFGNSLLYAEEGMYPINMLYRLNLEKKGLKIETEEIYNDSSLSLSQAVVQIGGCTGSFISPKGLIVTNHHCAFGSLEPYSSPDNNLLEKGYLSNDSMKELPMKGLTCRIMKNTQDVSYEVLKGVDLTADPIIKRNMINANMKRILEFEKLKQPDLQVEISEMLPGKSYVMFNYFLIKDLRIVYIPPRKVGEFGGETDNWSWPRHTGDFSLVRAYVSKDGKGTEYSKDNIPFAPSEVLSISSKGLKENDFLFMLGYPGRTFRHQPSKFIEYQQKFQLPYIAQLYEWHIKNTKDLGEDDEKWLIKREPRIKYLANVSKNYRGKLKTIHQIGLYEKKVCEERYILDSLKTIPEKQKYSLLLKQIDTLYTEIDKSASKNFWYSNLFTDNVLMSLMRNLILFDQEYNKFNISQSEKLKIVKNYKQRARTLYNDLYIRYDSLFFRKMLRDSKIFKGANTIPISEKISKIIIDPIKFNQLVEKSYRPKSKFLDSNQYFRFLDKNKGDVAAVNDIMYDWIATLTNDYKKTDSSQIYLKSRADLKLPEYTDYKMIAFGSEFIPDANRTLRFSYGKILGYSPSDATTFLPFTTAKGMLEKDGTQPDYVIDYNLAQVLKNNQFGAYKLKDVDDVPMCVLYNTDTTGGNSGSPVLNDKGELVALNFDRTFEATINDYAWNNAYSRSIGLDVRFILWDLVKVAKAEKLLKEMYIK